MPRERTPVSVRRRLLQAAGFSAAALLACVDGACGGIGEGGTGAIPDAGGRDTSVGQVSSSGSSSSGAASDDGAGFGTDDASGDGSYPGDGASDDAGDDGEVDAQGDAGPGTSSDDASDDGSPGSPEDASSVDGASSDGTVGGTDAAGALDGSSGGGVDATVGASDAGTDANEHDATAGSDASADAGSSDGSTIHASEAGVDSGGGCNLGASWGIKVVVDVSWPSTGLVNWGGADYGDPTEQVEIWALLSPTGSASGTSIPATIRPCNIVLPDFGSIIGETYGATFPSTLFDHTPPYLTAVSTTLTFGATTAPTTFTVPGETNLIGMSAPATGAWPSAASGVTEVDMDVDGEPGVTAISKAPPTYSYVPTTIIPSLPDLNLVRADKLYMAIRFVTSSLSGSMSSCTAASGGTNSVVVDDMDSHILGCHVYSVDGGAGDCTATQATFVDNNRPVFAIDSASFTAAVVTTANCASVVAALPENAPQSRARPSEPADGARSRTPVR
jgi:hypothetical protein